MPKIDRPFLLKCQNNACMTVVVWHIIIVVWQSYGSLLNSITRFQLNAEKSIAKDVAFIFPNNTSWPLSSLSQLPFSFSRTQIQSHHRSHSPFFTLTITLTLNQTANLLPPNHTITYCFSTLIITARKSTSGKGPWKQLATKVHYVRVLL